MANKKRVTAVYLSPHSDPTKVEFTTNEVFGTIHKHLDHLSDEVQRAIDALNSLMIEVDTLDSAKADFKKRLEAFIKA
jgi:hypothetical protein